MSVRRHKFSKRRVNDALRESKRVELRVPNRRLPLCFLAVSVVGLLGTPYATNAARHWFNDENRTLRTERFEASAARNAFCDPNMRDSDLFIYLRFAPGIDIEVGNNEEYLGIVESEIAPAVKDVCGEVSDLVVLNYFAEKFRNSSGNEIPASRAVFRNLLVDAYPARVKWVWFDAIFSGEFPPNDSKSFGDSRLTTPSTINAWLSSNSPEQLVESFKSNREESNVPEAPSLDGKLCGPIPAPYRDEEYGAARYALENRCVFVLSSKEILYAAGVGQGLLDTCDLPKEPKSRSTVKRFLAATNWAAIGGRERSNPDLRAFFGDQAESLSAFAAGRTSIEAIGCSQPIAGLLSKGLSYYLDITSKGEGARFVEGCVAHFRGVYTEDQCRCAADKIRAIIPDIHQREYSSWLLKRAIERNPLVGGSATLGCGITKY